MCTVSWFATPLGYELFFNRDESRKRLEASPPEVRTSNSSQYLSPTDEQAGGSWIASNQFGVTICLLNLYIEAEQGQSEEYVSRGEIVRQLINIRSLDEIYPRLTQTDLRQYRTFRIFAIDSAANNVLLAWDGNTLSIENDVSAPKSSSSVETQQVVQTRKKLFIDQNLNMSVDRDEFFAFQRCHEPDKNYSVCVHREFTKTVSFSHVIVNESDIKFDYFADSPCKCTKPFSTRIERKMINYQSDVA